jgi:hypothetical protein
MFLSKGTTAWKWRYLTLSWNKIPLQLKLESVSYFDGRNLERWHKSLLPDNGREKKQLKSLRSPLRRRNVISRSTSATCRARRASLALPLSLPAEYTRSNNKLWKAVNLVLKEVDRGRKWVAGADYATLIDSVEGNNIYVPLRNTQIWVRPQNMGEGGLWRAVNPSWTEHKDWLSDPAIKNSICAWWPVAMLDTVHCTRQGCQIQQRSSH